MSSANKKNQLNKKWRSFVTGPIFRPLAVGLFTLLLVGFAIPLPNTVEEVTVAKHTSDAKSTDELELGQQKIEQEGVNGELVVTYSAPRSIFDMIFGNDVNRTELSRGYSTAPVEEVVVKGTKKYQYMYCSDGSYRYYTDEQFKDANTGFTHRSEDSCAKNGNGSKTQLASAAPGVAPASITPRGGCTFTKIPFNTVYKDASWVEIGQTSTTTGYEGTQMICPGSDSKYNTTVDPIDKIVYRGTKAPASTDSGATSPTIEPDMAARSKCMSDYNSAKAQLQAAGAGNSSAMTQLNSLYQICMRKAGF